MSKISKTDPLDVVTKKLGIGSYTRHMLFCGGPKCCSEQQGDLVWDYIKKRVRELGDAGLAAYRSKVVCLRICREGPIAVVYPEGTWYRLVDEAACERILVEHMLGGVPVKDFMFAENPLGAIDPSMGKG